MPGRGPAPKPNRRRRNVPVRGEFVATPGVGWQHGAIPSAPEGLKPASLVAWTTWMQSWFASHWTPNDLPGLRVVVLLYDQVERGEYQRAAELRMSMDNYGITPKGQQDRRWVRPDDAASAVTPKATTATSQVPAAEPYRHLAVVAGGKG